MAFDKKTILTIIITLALGVAIGGIFLGGSESSSIPAGHDDHAHELNAEGLWTCSMHPQVKQSEPGSCPFCGMDLIPLNNNDDSDPLVLKMSNSAMQLANIQTTVIESGNMTGALTLNGKVKTDTRRVNTQTTHFGGRIEKLYKNYEGELVRKGDKIAALYSPELLAAQEELIEAKKLEKSNPVLLEAARKKLRYWKLSDEQVQAIEQSNEPMRNFDLLADFDGVITKKMVTTGDHLHEGEGLLEITNLSKLWIVLEVYEQDLDKVRLGDQIAFETPALPEPISVRISFISPEVDPGTRIVAVRADIDNRQGLLKPDMFVKAEVSTSSNEGILVPQSAVLWTGKRSIVYIKKAGEQAFQLREIEIGKKMDGYYQVIEGLETGEEVVTNGAFTIDAEAQLQGKNSMMNPAITLDKPESAEFKEVELPGFKDYHNMVEPEFQDQLMELSLEYLKLKDLMVEGNGADIRKAGISVKNSLNQVDMTLTKGEGHMHWMELVQPMEESLKTINSTGDRDVQRLQFINLSKALINAVQSFGTSLESPLYIQFCPMANNDKGATWISREEEIINPYFGDVMLNCGNVEDVIMNEEN